MNKYLAEEIGEDFKTWQLGSPIVITTPTGSGKTTFLIQRQCEYAVEEGEKVALLVNRKALKNEVQIEMYKNELRIKKVNSNLLIFTYQEIEGFDDRAIKKKRKISDCKYVYLDEAHYFISDSRFNSNNELSYEFILGLIKTHIVVYMSATPQDLLGYMENSFEEIYRKECILYDSKLKAYEKKMFDLQYEFAKEYANNHCEDIAEMISLSSFIETQEEYEEYLEENQYEEPVKPEKIIPIIINPIRVDYSYLDIKHFKEINDVKAILSDLKGKCFIFVFSKKVGMELKEYIERADLELKNSRSIIFIDKDYDKNPETFDSVQSIINNGMLTHDIIISTSTLDNGISISDPKLKHMIILASDKTEFIQMLGRKRISKGQRLSLYISEGNINEFEKQRNRIVKDYIGIRDIANKNYVIDMKEVIVNPYYYNLIGKALYISRENIIKLSKQALYSIQLEYNRVCDILDKMKNDPHAFLKMQYEWLELEYKDAYLEERNVFYDKNILKKKRDEILKLLQIIEIEKEGILSKMEFDELANTVLGIFGEKSLKNPKQKFDGILKKYPELEKYNFCSISLNKQKFYFWEWKIPKIQKDIKEENIKKILAEYVTIEKITDLYTRLYGVDIPECIKENVEIIIAFINYGLKEAEIKIVLRRSGSNLSIARAGEQIEEKA